MDTLIIGIALNFSLMIINFIIIIGVLLHYREFTKKSETMIKLFSELQNKKIVWTRRR